MCPPFSPRAFHAAGARPGAGAGAGPGRPRGSSPFSALRLLIHDEEPGIRPRVAQVAGSARPAGRGPTVAPDAPSGPVRESLHRPGSSRRHSGGRDPRRIWSRWSADPGTSTTATTTATVSPPESLHRRLVRVHLLHRHGRRLQLCRLLLTRQRHGRRCVVVGGRSTESQRRTITGAAAPGSPNRSRCWCPESSLAGCPQSLGAPEHVLLRHAAAGVGQLLRLQCSCSTRVDWDRRALSTMVQTSVWMSSAVAPVWCARGAERRCIRALASWSSLHSLKRDLRHDDVIMRPSRVQSVSPRSAERLGKHDRRS